MSDNKNISIINSTKSVVINPITNININIGTSTQALDNAVSAGSLAGGGALGLKLSKYVGNKGAKAAVVVGTAIIGHAINKTANMIGKGKE